LFGSRARGDYKPWRDYDLLIVAEFDKSYMDRIGELLELLSEVRIVVEPHPYTLEETKEMLRRGNPLIVDAISEGIALHKDQSFLGVENIYMDLVKKGLRKTHTTVIVPSN
ncbi:MAG: nucleotidyltransferase domain-containing protein, partial [Candidatus Bathyarchaeota archaeon]|nr:nucleotidyltransferase domain-containing protein [Candidatus Bathyarchaeota archaeon]